MKYFQKSITVKPINKKNTNTNPVIRIAFKVNYVYTCCSKTNVKKLQRKIEII